MSDDVTKGVWLDLGSGQVVHSEPEEGIQLAAPGTKITPDVQRRIDNEVAAHPVNAANATNPAATSEPEPVTAPKSAARIEKK